MGASFQPLVLRSQIARDLGGPAEIRKMPLVFRRINGARIARELNIPLAERTLATRAFGDKERFGDFEGAKKLMKEFPYLEGIIAELDNTATRALKLAKARAISAAVKNSIQ